jgi:hypothetical protein
MTVFVTDFETHAIWQGYVEDPAAKDFVARRAHTIALSKAQGSCHKTSVNQPIHEFGYPFGDSIPRLYRVAWLGRGHARKCQSEDLCEKERYESCSVQWTFAQETFGKRQKRENSPVVRLLPGSTSILLRETHAFCARNMGAHVRRTSSECQGYEKRDEILDSYAAKKGAKKLVSSNFAKILEYKSSN